MSRISLLVAVAVAGGVVGCAQCDTCDDFPAPCVGPNCGQNAYTPPGYVAPMMSQGPAMMPPPTNDAAPAAPEAPTTPAPSLPPAESAPMPASPPAPADPAARPGD